MPEHVNALFVRHDIEGDAKGPRAFASGLIGPKQG
ncbi:protein of unknown function [Pseudomonas inefficax]|uniref:Uncharacterized protein n=1 Tax=Pseudomonas inefficax TaxID=2078786 RepID=A0AAQ1SVF9_9PSED|nr:protein of unknown function [Pseudomonas inefficax]